MKRRQDKKAAELKRLREKGAAAMSFEKCSALPLTSIPARLGRECAGESATSFTRGYGRTTQETTSD